MILDRPVTNSAGTLLDKFSIKELIEFERFCRDNAMWQEMKQCYSPESTVNISWYQGSGIGFVDASSRMEIRAPHKIYNTIIWLHGDKAFALTMATVEVPSLIRGVAVTVLSDAKLVYRLQKVAGTWYIMGFESIYEQDSIVPVYPDASLSIDPNDLAKHRKSYAGMAFNASQVGLPINEDLPGIDRPDLVDKLYQDANAWLQQF